MNFLFKLFIYQINSELSIATEFYRMRMSSFQKKKEKKKSYPINRELSNFMNFLFKLFIYQINRELSNADKLFIYQSSI
jgi:hypothetical protein